MPLTPKGYCDFFFGAFRATPVFVEAEMPLTPKGYCDPFVVLRYFPLCKDKAEMPLTPKGYCDFEYVELGITRTNIWQKCP